MAAFQYQPLDRSRKEIRLLILEDPPNPSRAIFRSTTLKCRMIHTSLRFSPRPDYYALSYVWGDPTPVINIEIDGKHTKITKNLAEALGSIQKNTNYHVIWADAICINQADNDEKGWQVQQMIETYARAHAVIAWLGQSFNHSDRALRDLDAM
ncbi:uncharacterized protein BDZ99DRAFT_532506, partial [Mytilinidion resinicola]